MPTENTSLKNTTPAGDFNTTNAMVIGKTNTYQRTFLIVAGSLLAFLVLIAVAGTSGGQHLQSSAHEDAVGALALADYQVDSANLALTQDIFGGSAVSENGDGCCCECSFSCLNCCNGGCHPPAPAPTPAPAPQMDCNICNGPHICMAPFCQGPPCNGACNASF